MNLFAYSHDNKPLFCRQARNKTQARAEVLRHKWLPSVDYIVFKKKKYGIGDVYRWLNVKTVPHWSEVLIREA